MLGQSSSCPSFAEAGTTLQCRSDDVAVLVCLPHTPLCLLHMSERFEQTRDALIRIYVMLCGKRYCTVGYDKHLLHWRAWTFSDPRGITKAFLTSLNELESRCEPTKQSGLRSVCSLFRGHRQLWCRWSTEVVYSKCSSADNLKGMQ